ncbi:MAG TPA: Crp/Fnr family transcriptional regulator [Chitinophagaceae bacterium]|nr:Crp/Fnr family transcriptional regulator [Chitinophagaceae bacterium]
MDWKKLFPQFEPELIEMLDKNAIERTFYAGEVIMRTGQYIKSTMLVLSGRIKIYRQNDEGGEFLIYYLGPGDACAISLICALQSQTSEITAKAIEDTDVLMLPVQLMDELMNKFKSWSHFVIQTYRNRFDEMLSVIDNIAFRNMDERLEFYLKRAKTDSGKMILNLTHQQIADDLNSSREVISRLLKKMEQLGKIRLNRNSIELVNL